MLLIWGLQSSSSERKHLTLHKQLTKLVSLLYVVIWYSVINTSLFSYLNCYGELNPVCPLMLFYLSFPVVKEMDKKMWWWQWDIKLDCSKYKGQLLGSLWCGKFFPVSSHDPEEWLSSCCVAGMSKMPRHHRERWWLQPHGVPEPELQSRILLGLPGALGATWLCLVSPDL